MVSLMTTSNESASDDVIATGLVVPDTAATPVCTDGGAVHPEALAPLEGSDVPLPVAMLVVREARRVEEGARAVEAEVSQYEQELLQILQANAYPPPATDAGSPHGQYAYARQSGPTGSPGATPPAAGADDKAVANLGANASGSPGAPTTDVAFAADRTGAPEADASDVAQATPACDPQTLPAGDPAAPSAQAAGPGGCPDANMAQGNPGAAADSQDKPASTLTETMEMGTQTPSQQELLERIANSSAGIKAAETAIQSALQTFMDATSSQVTNLVNNNTLYPEMREEMLKLEQRVMEMTLLAIDSIQARVPEAPKPNPKGKPK